jgi:hypothetical protein
MSIIFVVRDYLDQIKPLLYQIDETSTFDINLFRSFFKSFLVFIEYIIPSRVIYVFSFQWRENLIYIPILRPEVQLARSNSRVFSTIPLFPIDSVSRGLNFSVPLNLTLEKYAFQNGLFNSFFLALPVSLSFVVSIRRYWLQGFKVGLRGSVGYRRGETLLLIRVANGFGPVWWNFASPFPISSGLLLTTVILWESISYRNSSYWQSFFGEKNVLSSNEIVRWLFNHRYLIFVRIIHFFYSWTELGTFFGIARRQTSNNTRFSGDFSNFSHHSITYFNYRSGLFLGGLLFDLIFRIGILARLEILFFKFRYPLVDWKQKIHKLTRYFIISFSFRRIPYYSADYLSFSSFGFFGRDTELKIRVAQNFFSEIPLSILLERRNVIGEDTYGRASPDIPRKPLGISRIAVEASRDLVDETYRTQQTNQRVDSVYLGALERKIFEWLSFRGIKSSIGTSESNSLVARQNEKSAILVGRPVRKGISSGSCVTPRNNPLTRKIPHNDLVRVLNRFDLWCRTTRSIIRRESRRFFGLPLDRSVKVPESLFSLSASDFSQQSYLSSIGWVQPERAIRYSNFTEFSRKRNARRSPLHRGPIVRYIDLFLKTRSKIKGSSVDVSTRQQQRDLYKARIILHKYSSLSRSYIEIEQNSYRKSNSSSILTQRAKLNRKIQFSLFGGNRSRANSVYSQQYVGNLQLIRRLFSISWAPIRNSTSFQVEEGQFLRRKISLDKRTFDVQKSIFEHEEIGKVVPLKSKILRNQISENPLEIIDNQSSLFGKRLLPDSRIEGKPLYAGWDNQKHAFVLCNRFLPLEWSIRTKIFDKYDTKSMSYTPLLLKNLKQYHTKTGRKEFTAWPKNYQTRRIRLRNVRYNRRAFLGQRVPIIHNSTVSLLAQDRSVWSRKAGNWDASQFAFWFNPRSDIQRNNPIIVRGSQRFPVALARTFRYYTPGDLQPSIRGGCAWPGLEFFVFSRKG